MPGYSNIVGLDIRRKLVNKLAGECELVLIVPLGRGAWSGRVIRPLSTARDTVPLIEVDSALEVVNNPLLGHDLQDGDLWVSFSSLRSSARTSRRLA